MTARYLYGIEPRQNLKRFQMIYYVVRCQNSAIKQTFGNLILWVVMVLPDLKEAGECLCINPSLDLTIIDIFKPHFQPFLVKKVIEKVNRCNLGGT